MKKLLLLILLGVLFTSCKNKDELITMKPWYLSHKFNIDYKKGKSISKLTYFKKSEEKLVFKFNINGTLKINEDNGKKYATVRWEWKTADKKYFNILTGIAIGTFTISELNSKELQISKQNIYSSNYEILYFKHFDDADWKTDDEVYNYNKIAKK